MNRRNKKREFEDRGVLRCFKKPKRSTEKFKIVHQVKSQKSFRSQLVFAHGEFNFVPTTVLKNAIDRINATLNVTNIGQCPAKEGHRFVLYINNEHIAEGIYMKKEVARRELAKVAIDELKKTCFTIFQKIRPRDSPTVEVNSNAPNLTQSSSKISGIGAKMLVKMGWSGGGLGSQGQGTTEIVKVSSQIDRQGFGTENKVPFEEIKSILQSYASSDNMNSISFSPDFNKDERAVIHSVAKMMHLKSSSYGSGANRRLVVQKKINLWQLVYMLLEAGGENDQYRLILPSDFVK